jgi:hypothetical protein
VANLGQRPTIIGTQKNASAESAIHFRYQFRRAAPIEARFQRLS